MRREVLREVMFEVHKLSQDWINGETAEASVRELELNAELYCLKIENLLERANDRAGTKRAVESYLTTEQAGVTQRRAIGRV